MKMEKRASKVKKNELLQKMNSLETRFKRTGHYPTWDNRIKDLFKSFGVYSFEDLIHKDYVSVESLILNFSDCK
jgi:hypothetical protein